MNRLNQGVAQQPIQNEVTPVEKPIEEETGSEDNQDFSEDDLVKSWNAYAESIRDEMPRSFSTLKSNQPVFKEGFVQLILNNQAQIDDFNSRVKNGLLGYLKKTSKTIQLKLM
ncbi:MAG: hypothetical protein HC906_07515 [Bacteroidales bacterium]|nr:hypothetical protein [Bacteroidales bacterium]